MLAFIRKRWSRRNAGRPSAWPPARISATLSPRSWARTVARLGLDDLGQVEAEQLSVSHQRVAPAGRLVGEPVAGEVDRADPKALGESVDGLVPVDAAGRKAVHEQQHRRVRVACLHVEDLHRLRVRVVRGPGEIFAAGSPVVGSRGAHALDPTPAGPRDQRPDGNTLGPGVAKLALGEDDREDGRVADRRDGTARHRQAQPRLAVVSEHDWIAKAMELFAWAMPGDLRVFDLDELDDAKTSAAG